MPFGGFTFSLFSMAELNNFLEEFKFKTIERSYDTIPKKYYGQYNALS